MELAHYTDIFKIADIVREGIAKGEVAVTPVDVINFPWFTSEFSQNAQAVWAGINGAKLTLRLEVEFSKNDECLVCWRDYATRLRIRDDWYKKTTGPRVAMNGRTWFVYRGVVPFDWIKRAYFHPCHERVTPADLRRAAEIIAPLNLQSSPMVPCRHLTEEEALNLTDDQRKAAHSEPVAQALHLANARLTKRPFHYPSAATFIECVKAAAEHWAQRE